MSIKEQLKAEGYRYVYRWNENPSVLTATRSKKYKGDFPNKAVMDEWTLDLDDVCPFESGKWIKL